jgi:hypothetical protein
MDEVLSLHELMHHTHVNKQVGIILKLDLGLDVFLIFVVLHSAKLYNKY